MDPVVLFKIVFIQHLYGIPSLRRTCEEIKMNVAYRWFLGYLMNEQLPHFSTVSQNFRHRFTEETIDKVFEWILSEVEKHGYLSPEAVFVDGTHIKANANLHKAVKKAIPKAAREYEKQLMEETNADREAHGKKPLPVKNAAPDEQNNNDKNNDDQNGSENTDEKIEKKTYSLLILKLSHNPQRIRNVACFTRASIRNALRMKHILPATNTAMFSV